MTPEEFRKVRKAARMTQAQLAERLGVSRKTVVNWEGGVFVIPDTALDTLTEKGVALVAAPAETDKQWRVREAAEAAQIRFSVETYRRMRMWPHGSNHRKAMAYLATEGTTLHPGAYAAIVAEFPDILSDPDGDYSVTKEKAHAVLGITSNPSKQD